MNTTVYTTVALAGYRLLELLYCGTRTAVYRGIRLVDSQPVALKLLQLDYPSFHDLLQFRNQYANAKNLNIPGIIRPYSLESYRNSYALVMEDFGGVSLRDYTCNRGLAIAEVLEIALQLAQILHDLQQNRVIHKDIKPANILIHPKTKQVKLIDFSIASLLPKETQEIKNPNGLEGTLAYLSPEQTGRMNRGIDYRSDFYNLGVTLFELLAGQLPFQSDEPMELVHCHIAKQPPALTQFNIPEALGNIAMKLMAKNAEDRYQSALGLKYDLEICLHQLKETGKIEGFEIGTRDVSDRFLIPEKLYGRETEVQTLLEAFDRVANGRAEMMLLAGFSGIGKTAVVNEVHKPITRQKGYFIKGKFDQFNRNIPFSAFVQALRDLIGQLLSQSDGQLAQWRTKILAVVGENGQVLIEVIPELEIVIGKQPPAPELSGTAAQNRFNLLFQKFIALFATKEHPLVMFLDDLQWSDSASLQLMKLLMSDNSYLLLLGAYRDNEVSPVHPFILTVDDLKKSGKTVNTIALAPLAFSDTNQLVADTLHCDNITAQPLTELIVRKTKGNPFFTTQFLKALHEDGQIIFNRDQGYWECDLTQVKALSLTDDVVEFMAQQLQRLPAQTQEILKLAACIGNQFDLNTLAIVAEKSATDAADALWKSLQEGLILPQSEVYKFYLSQDEGNVNTDQSENVQYRFLHDRVQQAAYSLIPENQKQATHLKIGRLLQQKLSEIEKEEKLFDIVGHFNLAIELIDRAEEQEYLAQLNLAAGQKARNSIAYAAARSFVQTGLGLLAKNCWQTQYELSLNLYVAAAEMAYLNADFDSMEAMADRVLSSAQTILDKVKIYEIQISALTAQVRMLEAIAVGRNALAQLGVDFSSESDETLTDKALPILADRLQGKPIEELVNLPVMSDPHKIAAMQLLAMLFIPIFLGNPALLSLLCSTMVSLSLQFGNAPASTIGYAGYGMMLSAGLGEIERGYSFGRVAMGLLERLNVRQYKCITLLWFASFLQHRTEALRATIPTLKQGYLAGMESGDFLHAGHNMSGYFDDNFFGGVALDYWDLELENCCLILANVKQDSPLTYLKMKQQMVQNWREIVERPDLLSGTAYDEKLMLPKHLQDNELNAIAFAYIYKLMLAYVFSNYTDVLEYIAQANLYLTGVAGLIHTPIFHFYAALTYLALINPETGLLSGSELNQERFAQKPGFCPEIEQANALALVETHENNLAKWAHHAPINHQHKVDLIEAEKCRVLGKNYEAGDWYDRAIKGAKANEYIQEEALANELAAKFYLAWGKEKVAAGYMQEAYYCYAKWGALAKTSDLEKRYPQLLQPIIQEASTLNTLETLATLIAPNLSIHTSTSTSPSSSYSINNLLDFTSIIKAYQAISSMIQIEELLGKMTQIILQNSGGDRCVLIVPNLNQSWQVRAIATPESTKLCSELLDNNPQISIKLIQYVKNTRSVVVIDDMKTDLPVICEYLNQQQPQSVLCLPILNQGQLRGILYLENRVTSGAFTSDRILILNFLCTQAAISLENARLYRQVQQTLEELQQAQLQIVQSEKMSALGNLVAGVAHEINNPVGSIVGNVSAAQDYINDLLGIIDLYQKTFPQPGAEIEDELEAIDLDYVRSDLPKLIRSMKDAGDRIKSISQSLRTFSRADSDTKQPFNLHEGIDSTILILRHRLKANENRPAIKVVTDYGQLPEIACFPGQLNQVFMNILANAIDAIYESNHGRSFAEIQANPNRITIRTRVEGEEVKIAIADNGKGIPEDVKPRIFDHLFTTKNVGKGTGLGLAIARQIIVEKHGGRLEVNSTPGQGSEFAISIPVK
ncbi:MAG TPA: serine/threonine protein kinase [Cyanobacteria bacterium UBA11372]|nr:serine/threonine protein kinase [Cyanobacteria bacterium UBA11372]